MLELRLTAACIALLLAAPIATACSSDDEREECHLRPAFELSVRAAAGPIPDDLHVKIKYGGGVEEYSVSDTVQTQEVLFCQHRDFDGGVPEAGAPVGEVFCKLWTQGATDLTVESATYPRLEKRLEAKASGDCIQTVAETVVLGDVDGGT
ncbi:MAG: hypothetical protein R3B13_15660 [Polyangiaceae bacterium]